MQTALDVLVAFVAIYPITTAGFWIAGGLMFRLWEERPSDPVLKPEGDWPGVSVLIPAYYEEAVIATSVRAALSADYPQFEVLVLDGGSTDDTEAAALAAAAGDRRFRVLRDPVNRGKAEQLNVGFARARHELVIVTDADTHMHPHAIRFLVARIESSPLLAAVAGGPHLTNRDGLICAMQVPSSLPALWAQRKRGAREQGEVMHTHLRDLYRWRNHRMWLLSGESLASLIWVACLGCSLVLSVLNVAFGQQLGFFGVGLAWGVAISVVATLQLIVALALRYPYDHWDVRAMLLGVIYPMLFWIVSASAAVNQQLTALIRGPQEQRVVWDIPREPLDSASR